MTSRSIGLIKSIVTMGGEQNFLGARWTSALAQHAPAPLRRPVALWLLSLSPHYFYGRDREAESERARTSREQIAKEILLPGLRPHFDVLDYGCGPGYLARAVAPHVRTVHAVDISRGALACARILNPASNIRYDTPDGFAASSATVDFAYSFAVAPHLTDDVLRTVLASIARSLRPGGRLCVHVVLDAPGWRDEASWRADSSLTGRIRMRRGLRCFARTEAAVRDMVEAAGFTDVRIEPVAGRGAGDDDIAGQHLLLARRCAAAPPRHVRHAPPAEPGTPCPAGACPTCGTPGERVSGDFDGYIEGYRVCVLECPRCTLRFSSRLDVPGGLYDAIYRHAERLPGYDRYARYAAAVPRHPRPLDLLASGELPYWYVRDHVRHRLRPGATVVDFGCGEGYLTYALRRAGITCFGVDISTATIARARRRFGHEDWFLTTEEFTGRPPAAADLVIALELIEHVADPAALLSGALATLRPGGCVLVTTPNRDASPAGAVWDTDLPPVHLLWFGTAAIRELAARVDCDVTFPVVPGGGTDVPRPARPRRGTWPPLLTVSGELSAAVRRAHSLPWRVRHRAARSLAWVSGAVDRSPLREIPDIRRDAPATLGACFTPRARTARPRPRSPEA